MFFYFLRFFSFSKIFQTLVLLKQNFPFSLVPHNKMSHVSADLNQNEEMFDLDLLYQNAIQETGEIILGTGLIFSRSPGFCIAH
jgi:hypothetical protein